MLADDTGSVSGVLTLRAVLLALTPGVLLVAGAAGLLAGERFAVRKRGQVKGHE